jgi:predicted nucleotidyltransferase
MEKLTLQDITDKGLLLYHYIRGSQAYGTSIPESDEDYGLIYVAPNEKLLGLGLDYQEEILDEKGK